MGSPFHSCRRRHSSKKSHWHRSHATHPWSILRLKKGWFSSGSDCRESHPFSSSKAHQFTSSPYPVLSWISGVRAHSWIPRVTVSPCWVLATGSSGAECEGAWSYTCSSAGPADPPSLAPAAGSQSWPRCSWRRRRWRCLGSPVLKEQINRDERKYCQRRYEVESALRGSLWFINSGKQLISGKHCNN